MKVIADRNIPFAKEAFSEYGEVITVAGREITKEILKDASILLVRSITKVDGDLLEGTSVKFVATATTGIDHIDTAYLKYNSIGFASSPGSNADSVAEYIVSALMQLAHEKKFKLSDCTLGIIGVGNVGSRVFKRAQVLGMRYLPNDPPKKRLTNSDFYLPLDNVLRESDIITIHVPLTMEGADKTYQMVNSDFINKMKNGTILINTSRGKVVDEKRLCEVAAQKFNGLIIDVWENEPTINLDLLKLADIATPHIAGYSYNAKIKATGMIHDAACAFFFRENKWQEDKIINKLKGGIIDVSKTKDPVYNAVKEAYPVLEDDKELREIVKQEENKQNVYFDKLRKNYRKRLEFSHFSIKADTTSSKDKEILANLGFCLKE